MQSLAVFFTLLIGLAAAFGIGHLARFRGLIAVGFGICLIASGTNAALWLISAHGLRLWLLLPLGVLTSLALAWLVRMLPWREEADAFGWPDAGAAVPALILIALLFAILVVGREPAAETNYFDAWIPEWLSESFKTGYLIQPGSTSLGPGFMSSGIYYPWNLLGFITITSKALSVSPFVALLAIDALAKLTFVGLLFLPFRGRPQIAWALAAFTMLLVCSDRLVVMFVAMNAYEEAIVLSAGLIFIALVREGNLENRLLEAMTASCFLVLSRNYGAAYGALIICVLGVIYIRAYRDRTNAFPWRALAVGVGLFGITASHETSLLIASGNVYFPRDHALHISGFTLVQRLVGLANDLGIVQSWSSRKIFPAAKGLWIPALVLFVISARKHVVSFDTDSALRYLAPVLLLAAPVALELLTGYRRFETFSKLYAVAVPFFIGMPIVWLSAVPQGQNTGEVANHFDRELTAAIILVGVVIGTVVAALGSLHRAETVIQTMLLPTVPIDETMANRILYNDNAVERADVRQRRILYFHYEPGIGLRIYLGGNLFRDLDFWSPCVLGELTRLGTFERLIGELGAPNIYLPHDDAFFYERFVGVQIGKSVKAELDGLANAPYVARVIVGDGGARFYQTKPGFFGKQSVAACTGVNAR